MNVDIDARDFIVLLPIGAEAYRDYEKKVEVAFVSTMRATE